MKGNSTVLSYYDCLLRTSDVSLLEGPFWINDALIGFYFEYLDKKYNTNDEKKYIFIGPEVTQLLKMTDPSEYNSFLDHIDLSDSSTVCFPLNNCEARESAGGTHWSLLVYSNKEEMCYHYDSCAGLNNETARKLSKKILQYFVGKSKNRFVDVKCLQQKNGYDCGIHTLCCLDRIVEHSLKNDNISDCDVTSFSTEVETKRSQLLKLIQELKETDNSS